MTQIKTRTVPRQTLGFPGISLGNEVAMNSSPPNSDAPMHEFAPWPQDSEFTSEEEQLRWCGLNELLMAVELDGITELSADRDL